MRPQLSPSRSRARVSTSIEGWAHGHEHREGQPAGEVRDRSQVQAPNGNWTERDSDTGRLIDQKQDGSPFKGPAREVAAARRPRHRSGTSGPRWSEISPDGARPVTRRAWAEAGLANGLSVPRVTMTSMAGEALHRQGPWLTKAQMLTLAEVLRSYDEPSVQALLFAACSSPTSRQQITAVHALWAACVRHPPAGDRQAQATDLPDMVRAAHVAVRCLGEADDWLPLDPAAGVLAYRRDGEPFPLHPGGLDDPLGDLDAVERYARVLDAHASSSVLGCSLTDLLDVAGELMRDQHRLLSPHWPPAFSPVGPQATITGAELDSARRYLEKPLDDRTARVLAAVAVHPAGVRVAIGWPMSALGPVLGIRRPDGRLLPVPAGLMLSGVAALCEHVARESLDLASLIGRGQRRRPGVPTRRSLEASWRHEGLELLIGALAAAGTHVFHPVQVRGVPNADLTLIVTGHRHAVLLDLISGLDPRSLNDDVRRAGERLAGRRTAGDTFVRLPRDATRSLDQPGTVIDAAGLTWIPGLADALPLGTPSGRGWRRLAPGTVLRPLVLVHGPWRPPEFAGAEADPVRTVAWPVSMFRDALLDARRAGEAMELWTFLDEVDTFATADDPTAPPVSFHALDPKDLWAMWCEHGMLAPPWRTRHAVVAAGPADARRRWREQAERTPLDALLHGLGLPTSRHWHSVDTAAGSSVAAAPPGGGAPGWGPEHREVTSLTRLSPRLAAFASVCDGLVVSVSLEDDTRRVDRHAAVTLADALHAALQQLAVAQRPVWDAWRSVHTAGRVHVHLTAGLQPLPAPSRGSAVHPVHLDDGFIVLSVDFHRASGARDDELHTWLGEALAAAPARVADPADLVGQPNRAAGTAAFLSAWDSTPPTLQRLSYANPFQPGVRATAHDITRAPQARAARSVAVTLAGRLDPGEHDVTVVNTVICPAAIDALRAAYAPFDPAALLTAACGEAERASAQRWLDRQHRQASLRGRWPADALVAAARETDGASHEVRVSRSAELLVEAVLRDPPPGRLTPDRIDVVRLLHLASWPLELALNSAHAAAGLAPARCTVSPFGTIAVTEQPTRVFDRAAWRQAQSRREFASVLNDVAQPAGRPPVAQPGDPAAATAAPGIDNEFAGIRTMLDREVRGQGRDAANSRLMTEVDDALLATWGTGFDAIAAVLATAASWPVPDDPEPPVARTTPAALCDDVARWSGLPRDQVAAAVSRLTLTGADLRKDDLRYWQLEKREIRLTLRPLVQPARVHATEQELWILPHRSLTTRDVLLRYLSDGRLPWPDTALPAPVRKAVRAWRKHAEDHLEDDALAAARSAGLEAASRVTPGRARRQGLELHGEIDVLAVDCVRRRFWVLECKHLHEPFSPPEIARHLVGFHGPRILLGGTVAWGQRKSAGPTHTANLLRKAASVRADLAAAMRAVTAASRGGGPASPGTPTAGEWVVVAAVVTLHTEVAAFVPDPAVAFVSLDTLPALLTAEALPDTGWWSAPQPLQ